MLSKIFKLAIGVIEIDVKHCAQLGIYTVRQFSIADIFTLCKQIQKYLL